MFCPDVTAAFLKWDLIIVFVWLVCGVFIYVHFRFLLFEGETLLGIPVV